MKPTLDDFARPIIEERLTPEQYRALVELDESEFFMVMRDVVDAVAPPEISDYVNRLDPIDKEALVDWVLDGLTVEQLEAALKEAKASA